MKKIKRFGKFDLLLDLKKQKVKRILDFGCNDGLLYKYLNNNINYWGVDNNKKIK